LSLFIPLVEPVPPCVFAIQLAPEPRCTSFEYVTLADIVGCRPLEWRLSVCWDRRWRYDALQTSL